MATQKKTARKKSVEAPGTFKNTREEVLERAIAYLVDNGHTDSDNGLPAAELVAAINKSISADVSVATVYNYLSRSANSDDDRKIESGGPHRGYWFEAGSEAAALEMEEEAEEEEELSIDSGKLREKDLYPLLSYWLRNKKGYNKSGDISSGTRGGLWGNPDVVGLNIIDKMGFFDVEILTIEAKLSENEWKKYFFEATSHKRFSNRSYFAVLSNKLSSKTVDDIKFYCERYNVGLLLIEMDQESLKKLMSWNDITSIDRVSLSERILETFPAMYEHISPATKVEFLERIGAGDRERLYEFGSTTADD